LLQTLCCLLLQCSRTFVVSATMGICMYPSPPRLRGVLQRNTAAHQTFSAHPLEHSLSTHSDT
jgi:hypothetical protein